MFELLLTILFMAGLTPGAAARVRAWESSSEEDCESSEDESARPKPKRATDAKALTEPESSPFPKGNFLPGQQSSDTQSPGVCEHARHSAPRGFKRKFSTMDKDDARDSGHDGLHQRPRPNPSQTLYGSPIRRGWHEGKRQRTVSPGLNSEASRTRVPWLPGPHHWDPRDWLPAI